MFFKKRIDIDKMEPTGFGGMAKLVVHGIDKGIHRGFRRIVRAAETVGLALFGDVYQGPESDVAKNDELRVFDSFDFDFVEEGGKHGADGADNFPGVIESFGAAKTPY